MTMLRIVRTFYQVLILPLSRFFSSLSKTLDLTYFFNMAGAEGLLRPFGIMVALLPYDNASHCSNLLSGSHPSAISFLFQLKQDFRSSIQCCIVRIRSFAPLSSLRILFSLTVYGWGGRIRTFECGDQNPVPCRLATPQ